MFSTTRYAAVLLMFSLAAPVMAAEQAAKVDTACAKPNFPTRWMSEGDSGDVVIAFLVGTDGKVVESKVLESSGHLRVDRASVRAGERCKFKPAARDGQAATGWAKVKYSWVID